MTNRGVLLRLLMERLGIDPQLGTFADRLRLQKDVYLLQELGLQTGFSYNWYIRGPYSPGLTAAAFEEVAKPDAQGNTTHEGFRLSDGAIGKLNALAKLTGARESTGLAEERWLELLASMHFYRHRMYFPPNEKRRRDNPAWLYRQLPPAKRTLFPESAALEAAGALKAGNLW